MKCSRLVLLTASAMLAAASPSRAVTAPDPERAAHTVSYYRAHVQAMQQMHALCTDDRTYENFPDCKNAAAAGDSMVRGPAGNSMADMYDPQSYRTDPVKRRIILAMCKTSTPPSARACQAALEAGSEGSRK